MWKVSPLLTCLLAVAAFAQQRTTVRPHDNGQPLVNPQLSFQPNFYSNTLANYGSKLAADASPPLLSETLRTAFLNLPIQPAVPSRPVPDWLIAPATQPAAVFRTDNPTEIVLTNGLIARTFRLAPNFATVALDNLTTSQSLIRGVKPEATLTIDNITHPVGGLLGQPNYAYLLPQWLDKMTADPNAFQLINLEVGKTKERFPWKRVRHCADLPWPPPGVSLTLTFKPPAALPQALALRIHYELYDGIPLLCKWLTLHNASDKSIRLQKFASEILAAVEEASSVEQSAIESSRTIQIESDYAFLGSDAQGANKTVYWVPDPQYETQVNYQRTTRCLLECRPPIGPDQIINPGQSFESFRTFQLIHDTTDRERRGLAQRRMYRTLAPWVTENPIMMHVVSVDPNIVKAAIDQCADVGFEMVILSFGSGLNMENPSPANVSKIKALADYAHSKGIEIGGYSLLASRSVSPEHDAINPKTNKPGGAIFDNSPCLMSQWGLNYFANLERFITATGFTLLEHDGSYPGDVCASTKHPGHRALDDSQWTQWRTITDFYKACRSTGIFLNVPDWYFLNGSNKTGMGYRETNWSLPRAQQIIHSRQNIFDGTWEKTPSMGWMFCPLTQYHGGGAAATIEPLTEHLDAYEAHLANNFGAGVQACYRGFRLYDTDKTRAVLKKWVDFYKKYRDILDSDIIHLRRADGRNIDCILHVNPRLKHKALAMMFNPTDRPRKQTLRLPLYYTGLTDTASIRREDAPSQQYKLDRQYNVDLQVEIQPGSVTWFVIE